jgi:hypothetical protein
VDLQNVIVVRDDYEEIHRTLLDFSLRLFIVTGQPGIGS